MEQANQTESLCFTAPEEDPSGQWFENMQIYANDLMVMDALEEKNRLHAILSGCLVAQ